MRQLGNVELDVPKWVYTDIYMRISNINKKLKRPMSNKR